MLSVGLGLGPRNGSLYWQTSVLNTLMYDHALISILGKVMTKTVRSYDNLHPPSPLSDLSASDSSLLALLHTHFTTCLWALLAQGLCFAISIVWKALGMARSFTSLKSLLKCYLLWLFKIETWPILLSCFCPKLSLLHMLFKYFFGLLSAFLHQNVGSPSTETSYPLAHC